MGIFSNIHRAFPNMWFMRILYGVIASLGVFLATWENGDRLLDRVRSKFQKQDTFDFIVVGSGSSGGVVANRLSENPHWKVLLLEVGGEPAPFHAIPGFSLFLTNYKTTDWGHLTVPQENSFFGSVDRQSLWSQGRALGGTSNLNYLIHLRGSPADFDHWGNITGDPSWNYENLLPYFRKSEDFRGEWKNSKTHGVGGPLRIESPPYLPLADYFVNAGVELGYPKTDLNGYYTEGFDNIYFPIKRGQRQAVFRSFIRPARRRRNLTIYKYSHVNKVLINGLNQAYGVEYERHGRKLQAFAKKEVIISAGTVQTPKILMLSGIGPCEHLHQTGIKCLADLPVGENLQDHVSTYLGPFIIDPPKSLLVDRDITAGAFKRFLTRGQGPLTTSCVQATGVYSSTFAKSKGEGHWPDLQTIYAPLGLHQNIAKDLTHAFRLRPGHLDPYYKPYIGKDSFTLVVSVGRPYSKGFIRLVNSDPTTRQIIDPKYFDHPADIVRAIEAVKINMKLVEETKSFKRLGARFVDIPLPGCENVPFRSDEYWDCFIRTYAVSLHHMTGTAAMGHADDPNAVVDTKLRVRGIFNLRVIDASVIPVIPVTNTQAPCIMIGEKGADLIKEAWGMSTATHTFQPRPATPKPSFLGSIFTRLSSILPKPSSTTSSFRVTPSFSTLADPPSSTSSSGSSTYEPLLSSPVQKEQTYAQTPAQPTVPVLSTNEPGTSTISVPLTSVYTVNPPLALVSNPFSPQSILNAYSSPFTTFKPYQPPNSVTLTPSTQSASYAAPTEEEAKPPATSSPATAYTPSGYSVSTLGNYVPPSTSLSVSYASPTPQVLDVGGPAPPAPMSYAQLTPISSAYEIAPNKQVTYLKALSYSIPENSISIPYVPPVEPEQAIPSIIPYGTLSGQRPGEALAYSSSAYQSPYGMRYFNDTPIPSNSNQQVYQDLQVPEPFAAGSEIFSIYEDAGEFEQLRPIESVVASPTMLANLTEKAMKTGFESAFPELADLQEQVVKLMGKSGNEGTLKSESEFSYLTGKPSIPSSFLIPPESYPEEVGDNKGLKSENVGKNNLYAFHRQNTGTSSLNNFPSL